MSPLTGSFQWCILGLGLEPGHQYQAFYDWRTDDGQVYQLGSNLLPVGHGGTLRFAGQELNDLTGTQARVDGYYRVTVCELDSREPAIGPDGQPLVFEQELEVHGWVSVAS